MECVQQEWGPSPVSRWLCRLGGAPFALSGPPSLPLQDEGMVTSGLHIPKGHACPLYSCPTLTRGMAGGTSGGTGHWQDWGGAHLLHTGSGLAGMHTEANPNPRVKFPNPWLGLPISPSAKLGSTLADTNIVTVHVGSCILLELNRLSKVKSSLMVGGGETED